MKKKNDKIPKFKNEDEEREFWATHSPLDYFKNRQTENGLIVQNTVEHGLEVNNMIEITATEARNKLSRLLEQVDGGKDIVITRRGKRVAVLTSATKFKTLPSVKKFRASITSKGKSLSDIVIEQRQKDRI